MSWNRYRSSTDRIATAIGESRRRLCYSDNEHMRRNEQHERCQLLGLHGQDGTPQALFMQCNPHSQATAILSCYTTASPLQIALVRFSPKCRAPPPPPNIYISFYFRFFFNALSQVLQRQSAIAREQLGVRAAKGRRLHPSGAWLYRHISLITLPFLCIKRLSCAGTAVFRTNDETNFMQYVCCC